VSGGAGAGSALAFITGETAGGGTATGLAISARWGAIISISWLITGT
jgi:hypothetical protein